MGVLKVRVNGIWEEVVTPTEPPLDEVWVGTSSPNPVGTYEIWYDTNTVPGVLKVKRETGEWEVASAASTSEVAVSATDPYDADPLATDELWFDTNIQQLMARVGSNWQPTAQLSPNEVFIGNSEPTAPDVELWFDPDAVPANATGSEVAVSTTDPYVIDPDATDELWWNPDARQLFVREGGAWRPTADIPPNEVFVGDTDPLPDVELWVDTTTDPAVLKARIAGDWVPVSSPGAPLAGDEVTVGPVDPASVNPAAELWVDTTDQDAPVLKARFPGAEWMPVAGDEAEVEVSDAEPATEWELWVDTSVLTPPPGVTGLAINDLTDVDTVTTAPTEGQGLGWNGAASNWVPQPVWKLWRGSQQEYDALGTYDNNVLYAIV